MILAILIFSLLVAAAVMIHYEMLRILSIIIPKLPIKHRLRVATGVFGTICAHLMEVGLFGLAFFLMLGFGEFGSLHGKFDGSLIDCIYFSFTSYTTIGYGDIEPLGAMRFLAGLEAITGLSLITWSASFTFMEMTKFWEDGK